MPLTERLGRIVAALTDTVTHFKLEVKGEIASKDVGALKLAALKGLFKDRVDVPVSYVNAPVLAEERGVDVAVETNDVADGFRNVITLVEIGRAPCRERG